VLGALRIWLKAYFAGERELPVVRTAPEGTEYQKALWEILKKIPCGKTATYNYIAGNSLPPGNRRGRQPYRLRRRVGTEEGAAGSGTKGRLKHYG
jgi:hypothetical protein